MGAPNIAGLLLAGLVGGRLPNSAKMESLDILEESVVGPLAAVLVPLLETLQREN